MKRFGLIFLLLFLTALLSVSSHAQPIPETYLTPGNFPAGEWSETLVGGSEGAQGNVINAIAVDYYVFGDTNAPALSDVILIGAPTADNRFYEYRTVYKGGALTLLNNTLAGWYNESDAVATPYQVKLDNTLVVTKKYVDSGGALTGEIEFALFVLDAGIIGYPGYNVTLTAKYNKGTPAGVSGSDPFTYGGPLSWAVITIKGPPYLEVPVDIKPGSCPNPINFKSWGVLPVAILGTSAFDISQIDPSTVRLNGVAPLRWSTEDVGTPFEPYLGKEGSNDCNNYGPDGFKDLTLKFNTQAIVKSIGAVADGTILILELTGLLKDGVTNIMGEDVVTILNKGKKW